MITYLLWLSFINPSNHGRNSTMNPNKKFVQWNHCIRIFVLSTYCKASCQSGTPIFECYALMTLSLYELLKKYEFKINQQFSSETFLSLSEEYCNVSRVAREFSIA